MAQVIDHTFIPGDPNLSSEFTLLTGQAYISISQEKANDSVRVYLERLTPGASFWKVVSTWERLKQGGWRRFGDPDWMMKDEKGSSEKVMTIADSSITYRFRIHSILAGEVNVYVGQG